MRKVYSKNPPSVVNTIKSLYLLSSGVLAAFVLVWSRRLSEDSSAHPSAPPCLCVTF